MSKNNLTQKDKEEIAIEMFREQPLETVCHVAILKLGELAVQTKSESLTQTTEATYSGKRYAVEMIITYKEITP